MSQAIALIVDDEPDILELLALTLNRMDICTLAAETVSEAKRFVQSRDIDLCLTDLKLPDGTGIDLIAFMQKTKPDVPIAVFTAHGSTETAVQAMKLGAFDFVSKPIDLHVLRDIVNTALRLSSRHHPQPDRRSRHTLLGDSSSMQKIRSTIAKVARSQAPVYISGESGTGKELVAKLIHDKGPRSAHAFVPVNCGAIPEDLMESEFFGHRKGSFTGAVNDKTGLFQAAQGGTLFLDEVADLPLHMQVKLLRAIQEKAVRPIGSEQEMPVDVRILSATHKDLTHLVDQGAFRQDLFYRLNVIEVTVPPLREREGDVPLLVNHIISKLTQELGLNDIKVSDPALQTLQHYTFPGNIRELENILERAATLCEDGVINEHDLQLPTASPYQASPQPQDNENGQLDSVLGDVEKRAILNALEQTRYNKTAAAKLLGISFRALRYRLKKLEID